MTFHRSSPRAKPRWFSLVVVVLTLTVVGAGLALAHGATVVPARYTGGTQVDIDPPPAPSVNDEPGQVDMTQMGRDTSVNPNVRIFWSWDAISAWTGKGQTGDACALFDNDNDGNINYVICARVSNTNANPAVTELLPAATNKPAYLFDCTDARNDRCSQPTPRTYVAGQVLAGPLAATSALTQSGAGNLQNETDPFGPVVADGPGEAYPHDTSLEIEVASALVPTGARLANVCSYPSAGNGGNNNPFDCIVTPGVQYGTLVVTKAVVNNNGGSRTVGTFNFTVGSGASTTGVQASTAFTPVGTSTTSGSNSIQLPVGTYSVAEVGVPITGYTTTYASGGDPDCTSMSVTAGNTTTCAITNDDTITSPSIKTAQSWIIKDTANFTGLVTGAPDASTATVTFRLWTTNTAGVCTGQVGSDIVVTGVTSASITTPNGIAVTSAGTYYWTVAYSGDQYNGTATSACGAESTTISKVEPAP